MNKVEIPLSKTKILLLALGSFAFVALGICFTYNPQEFQSPIMRNLDVIRIVGIVAFIFFGATGIYGIFKTFDNAPGLIVDEIGITDNSNASSNGTIFWKDILEIKVGQVQSTKFLLIYTSNPNKYLDKAEGLRKMLLKSNHKMYGTPLSITASTLKYKFDDLESLLIERLKAYQN